MSKNKSNDNQAAQKEFVRSLKPGQRVTGKVAHHPFSGGLIVEVGCGFRAYAPQSHLVYEVHELARKLPIDHTMELLVLSTDADRMSVKLSQKWALAPRQGEIVSANVLAPATRREDGKVVGLQCRIGSLAAFLPRSEQISTEPAPNSKITVLVKEVLADRERLVVSEKAAQLELKKQADRKEKEEQERLQAAFAQGNLVSGTLHSFDGAGFAVALSYGPDGRADDRLTGRILRSEVTDGPITDEELKGLEGKMTNMVVMDAKQIDRHKWKLALSLKRAQLAGIKIGEPVCGTLHGRRLEDAARILLIGEGNIKVACTIPSTECNEATRKCQPGDKVDAFLHGVVTSREIYLSQKSY
jgi:ribosomal protein S1